MSRMGEYNKLRKLYRSQSLGDFSNFLQELIKSNKLDNEDIVKFVEQEWGECHICEVAVRFGVDNRVGLTNLQSKKRCRKYYDVIKMNIGFGDKFSCNIKLTKKIAVACEKLNIFQSVEKSRTVETDMTEYDRLQRMYRLHRNSEVLIRFIKENKLDKENIVKLAEEKFSCYICNLVIRFDTLRCYKNDIKDITNIRSIRRERESCNDGDVIKMTLKW